MKNGDNTAAGRSYVQENFNLPNVLTSLRIIFIPVFAWLIIAGHMWWAFWLFVLLMITDKLDGDIARARNLITDFGKIADPIADKALMTTALICLNVVGLLPEWITVVIVIREFGITFWRMWMLRNGKVVPASKGGKVKTALQTVGIGLYLLPVGGIIAALQFPVMLLATLVTVLTGIQYLVDYQRENRS